MNASLLPLELLGPGEWGEVHDVCGEPGWVGRMAELGITSRDELTKMGLEFSKSGQLLTPLPQAMQTVLQLMKTKYGGLMDAQSSTFKPGDISCVGQKCQHEEESAQHILPLRDPRNGLDVHRMQRE